MATQIQTPPMPTSVGGVILSKNSYKVLCLCFLRKRPDGKPVETPDEMPWREATHVAAASPSGARYRSGCRLPSAKVQ